MQMNVSGISTKDGKKVAYVLFEDENCMAEAIVPDCRVTDSRGFDMDQILQLEEYMREHLDEIKKAAASVNPVSAFMKK